MTHINGLTTNESNGLRVWLANHMNRPEDQVRWRWRVGDLAMWDNRCTMHCVEPYDNTTTRRIMHRVTIVGEEKPILG